MTTLVQFMIVDWWYGRLEVWMVVCVTILRRVEVMRIAEVLGKAEAILFVALLL